MVAGWFRPLLLGMHRKNVGAVSSRPKVFGALLLGFVLVGLAVFTNVFFAQAAVCDRTATDGESLDAEFAAATPGETICLATGDYEIWHGGSKAVTITAQEGAAPEIFLYLVTGDSDFTLDGVTITGGTITNDTHDITIKNSAITGQIIFYNLENSGILLDNNTHLNINECGGCYGGRVHIGHDSGEPSGVTIQNSLFRGGSASGIETSVQAVIRNNEFDGLRAITLNYYAHEAHVVGNYIHDGPTGLVAYNGLSHALVENNVIGTSGRATAMEIGSDDSSIIRHNTFIHRTGCGDGNNQCGELSIGGSPGQDDGFGTVVTDNIVTGIFVRDDATVALQANNLVRHSPGPDDIVGVPVFVGMPNPTALKGYVSADVSPSRNAASDGKDIGINLDEPFSDTTPPIVSISNLSNGDTVSGVVTIVADARDDTGIQDVSFMVDGQAIGTADVLSPFTEQWNTFIIPDGKYTLTAVAKDVFAQTTTSASVTVTVDNSGHTPARSIWQPYDVPGITAQNDPEPVELGLKFQSDLAGTIDGVRFYKGAGNTGTHLGRLWATDGTLLASVEFTNETATGWQEALFDEPVEIEANTTYIVSYYAPNGYYSVDVSFFSLDDVYNYPLRALKEGVDGSNGVFKYGSGGGFPEDAYSSSNYWVDVVFSPPPDTTPPTVSITLPAHGATVGGGTVIAANAYDNEGVVGVQFQLDDINLGSEVTSPPYQISWDTTTVIDGTYKLTAMARDAAGNMATSGPVTVIVQNTQPHPSEQGDEPSTGLDNQMGMTNNKSQPRIPRTTSRTAIPSQEPNTNSSESHEAGIPPETYSPQDSAKEFVEKIDRQPESPVAPWVLAVSSTVFAIATGGYVLLRLKRPGL